MTHEFDISEINNYLYISIWPTQEQAPLLREMGIQLILSMYLRRPDKVLGDPPITLLWMPYIDSPVTPTPMSLFHRGVQAALPVIESGGKVLVHCKWGIHRSPAMACCILIAKGYNVNEAVELVKQQRPVAKPDDGYVLARIKKFEKDWTRRARKASSIDPA
jgi:protein-tyrosine phosphatase